MSFNKDVWNRIVKREWPLRRLYWWIIHGINGIFIIYSLFYLHAIFVIVGILILPITFFLFNKGGSVHETYKTLETVYFIKKEECMIKQQYNLIHPKELIIATLKHRQESSFRKQYLFDINEIANDLNILEEAIYPAIIFNELAIYFATLSLYEQESDLATNLSWKKYKRDQITLIQKMFESP